MPTHAHEDETSIHTQRDISITKTRLIIFRQYQLTNPRHHNSREIVHNLNATRTELHTAESPSRMSHADESKIASNFSIVRTHCDINNPLVDLRPVTIYVLRIERLYILCNISPQWQSAGSSIPRCPCKQLIYIPSKQRCNVMRRARLIILVNRPSFDTT